MINIPWAIGIASIMELLSSHPQNQTDDPNELKIIIKGFLLPVLALTIGWIAKHFM